MLLCRTGPFAHKSGKTAGPQSFCRATLSLYYLYAKICYAPGHNTGSLFFLLFAEALLLTGKSAATIFYG